MMKPTSNPILDRDCSSWPPLDAWMNVKFATMGGEDLFLNVYRPLGSAATLPLIVWIHGGGWKGENFAEQFPPENPTPTVEARIKIHPDDPRAAPKGPWPAWPSPSLWITGRGYALASISYRSSDKAPFPAQIEDCKAAIRWLRAHARKYNFDPKRVGVWGGSAGGHLAALVGTSGGVKDLEREGPYRRFSSRAKAVCSTCGPTDFLDMRRRYPGETYAGSFRLMEQLIGGGLDENPEKIARANPITYITPDDPPFLLTHGDMDTVVPVSQAEILHDALTMAGLDSALIVVKGGGHFFLNPNAEIAAFFDKHLREPC